MIWRIVRVRALQNAISARTSVGQVTWNEPVQRSIDKLLDWAQVTAVLLGALFALWVAKSDEPQLSLTGRYWPEISMWVAGAILLLAGLY
jgi:hypothetical protein